MSVDYTLGDTVYMPFTTRAFATGIPTALASGEVQIYEDASTTQITGAETLAVSLDSVVGFNMVTVVATGGNGFELGKSYTLILSAGTVDSVSAIGEVVGHFSLGMSAAAQDLANATDGLGALKALIDTIDDFLDTEIAAITAAVITNAAGADVAADIIAVKAETALIVADTGEIGTAGAGLTDLGGMSTGMKAEVNVEAKDVLFTDTDAEPGQGAPATTTSVAAKIGYLFKAWRNKTTQTASQYALYADDTTTIDQKAAVSDDATTFTRGEVATGP